VNNAPEDSEEVKQLVHGFDPDGPQLDSDGRPREAPAA